MARMDFLNATIAESLALNDLSDVTITSPVTGDFLYYNGTTWINYNLFSQTNAWTGVNDINAGGLYFSANTLIFGNSALDNNVMLNVADTQSDSVTISFPKITVNDTVAMLGVTQSFTGTNTFSNTVIIGTFTENTIPIFKSGIDVSGGNIRLDIGGSAFLRTNGNGRIQIGTANQVISEWISGTANVQAGSLTTPVLARIGGNLNVNLTQTGNTAATETTLFLSSLSGGTLNLSGNRIIFSSAGTFANSVTTDKQIRVHYPSGNIIFDTGALAITSSNSWVLNGDIVRQSSSGVKSWVTLNTSSATLSSYAQFTNVGSMVTLNTGSTIVVITGNGTNASDVVGEMFDLAWSAR